MAWFLVQSLIWDRRKILNKLIGNNLHSLFIIQITWIFPTFSCHFFEVLFFVSILSFMFIDIMLAWFIEITSSSSSSSSSSSCVCVRVSCISKLDIGYEK